MVRSLILMAALGTLVQTAAAQPQHGIVRFNGFHMSVAESSQLIDQPLAPAGNKPARATMPPSRSGQALLGKPMDLAELKWINTPGKQPVQVKGKVTLIRWWTNTCPYCAASLPAVTALSKEYEPRGFQSIAVYHPKPPRTVGHQTIRQEAARLGYRGLLAVDINWRVLEANYLEHYPGAATSVSFLLDRSGHVRYVHPGPVFGPSDEATDRQANQDYQDIKIAIDILLQEKH